MGTIGVHEFITMDGVIGDPSSVHAPAGHRRDDKHP